MTILAKGPTNPSSTWRSLIAGFGLILLFGGILFVLDGAWQNYQLHVRRTAWPAVEARVIECNIAGSSYYSSFRHANSTSSFVRCKFEYTVEGVTKQSTADIGNAVFAPHDTRTFLNSGLTVNKMQEWVSQHPAASPQTIHYNPSNPNEISLPEAEEELSSSSPEQRLWFGIAIACCGMLIMALGKRTAGTR